MEAKTFKRIPRHVGLIPDGNRRWAEARGLPKIDGYEAGVQPGLDLMDACIELGIQEITIYGFTQENAHRPLEQTEAFRRANVDFALKALDRGASLLVVGDVDSRRFPQEIRNLAEKRHGDGPLKVNLLVNYGWAWDLRTALDRAAAGEKPNMESLLASSEISRMELVIRWGGRNRLSGFLPVQSVYSDIYMVEDLWPDYTRAHLDAALEWYQVQDVTLGG